MNAPRDGLFYQTLAHAALAPRLLVASDFDGTLSELVDDPGAARPVPGAVEALGRLARCQGVSVAIVSGRARLDLLSRLGGASGIRLIGSHGLEPDSLHEMPDSFERAKLDTIGATLEEFAEHYPGTRVERKPFSAAFHVRQLDAARRLAALATARAAIRAAAPGAHEVAGHDVVEFMARRGSKGEALRSLAQGTDAVVFFGDDAADEQAFASVPAPPPTWFTVRVGGDRHLSSANMWVPSPSDVVAALEALAIARGG